MLSFFYLVLLFILPFLVYPLSPSFFETPKIYLSQVGIELLLLVSIFKASLNLKMLNKPFCAVICAIIALSFVALFFQNTQTTFFGNQFRMQGVFLLWHLIIWALISSQIKVKIPKLFSYLPLLTLSLVTIFLWTDPTGRAIGTLGEPNSLAAIAIFFWPFWFYSFVPKNILRYKFWRRILGPIILLGPTLAGLIIFLSNSRSGLLALFIQITFLVLLKISRNFKLAGLVCLFLILASTFLPFQENPGRFENRAQIWQIALFSGAESPIIGHGFGNIESALHNTAVRLNSNVQYYYADSAHNLFLDWWVEAGFLGVVSLLGLIFLSLRKFLLIKDEISFVLLFGLLTVMMFNPVSVGSLIAFWWLIGRGAAANQAKLV